MNPFFSVVIPTYNQASLLKLCLDSVIGQTFKDFEIIVVDNHSTDNTSEIVDSFNDSRIKLIRIHNEGVVARSRNKGIQEAKGDWICLLDSDDIWYNNKLELVHQTIHSQNYVDVVTHCMMLTDVQKGTKKIMKWNFKFDDLYHHLLLHGNKFINSALCIRKRFMIEHNITINEEDRFKSVEDYDMIMNIARNGGVFAYISYPLGDYNIYGTNMSKSDFHLVNLENLLRMHVYEIQTFEQNKDKLWKDVYAGVIAVKRANSLIKSKHFFKGLTLYCRAMLLSPNRTYGYIKDRMHLFLYRINKK